jgi:YggT family protein
LRYNAIVEIGQLLANLIYLYILVIFVWVMSSWLPQIRDNELIRLTGRISEPYLRFFRGIIPPIGGVLDISPIVAIFVLSLIARILGLLFKVQG